MKSTIRVLAFGAICVLCVGLWLDGKQAKQHTCPEPALNSVGQVLLLSQAEVQKQLIELGYDIGPKGLDGRIGPDSRKAWDTAYGNQCAAECWPEEKP